MKIIDLAMQQKKRLGGGVFALFVHEIDYANFLFGKLNKIQEVQYGKK